MVKLGSKARDIYTGLEGVAVGRTEWLYGCTRIGIEPIELKDGKPIDIQWFDEQRVEVINEECPKVSDDNTAIKGGPQADPTR